MGFSAAGQHQYQNNVFVDGATNAMQFYVKCSAQLQTVEFGGLQLLDLGILVSGSNITSTLNDYPGRLITDSWRADANARIAAYRKGNFTINVTGSSGAIHPRQCMVTGYDRN